MSERDEFEAAMGWKLKDSQGKHALSRAHDSQQTYIFLATYWAYEAWQAARAMQAMPALTEPVAWMHVMDNTEGIPENRPWVKITQSPENPFGVPGEDYSESFPVTSTPLYAAPQPSPEPDNCGHCHTCAPITMENMRMILCKKCGNKRCPHANDHRNACTGSNEPGQPGSAYPKCQD